MSEPVVAEPTTPIDSINNISDILLRIQLKLKKIQEEFGPIKTDFNKFTVEETNSNNYVKSLMADLTLIKTELSNINNPIFTKIINNLETDINKLYGLELDQIRLIPSVKEKIDTFETNLSTEKNTLQQRIHNIDPDAKEGGTPKKSNKKSKRKTKGRKTKRRKTKRRKSKGRKSNKRKSNKKDQIGDELYMAAIVAAAVNIGDSESTDTTTEVDI